MKNLVFDSVNCRVVTEDDVHVFYTDKMECPDDVIYKVTTFYNQNKEKALSLLGSEGAIDQYLLDEGRCSQEDREEIVKNLYNYIESIITFEKFEARGKQVWYKFENRGGGGNYAIANVLNEELALRIALALNENTK